MTITDSTGKPGGQPSTAAEHAHDPESPIRVTATDALRSTRTDAEGAWDVAVFVVLSWASLFGEVTVAPHPDPREGGQLVAFGTAPDHWISAPLLRSLTTSLTAEEFTAVCGMLEGTAARVALAAEASE